MSMGDNNAANAICTSSVQPAVLHCLDSYLRTTENWVFRLIKHQAHSSCYIASDRFLDGDFVLPDAVPLRSPLQPSQRENSAHAGSLRWQRAFARMTYPWYLRARLRHHKIDIVHSHFAQVGWRYRRVAQRLHAAHVVSFYGWDYMRLAAVDPSWAPRLKQLYAAADCFVCEGPHGAELLLHNGCPESKVRIVRLGVEPGQIPLFTRVKRAGSLRLLQIASFREKKGHIDTINAFANALNRWPDMHLTLVGAAPGEVYDSVTRIIEARGIAKKVSVLPGVQFNELYATMRGHHVFIHPSRHAGDGDCEGGAPVVLLDAQATGMPVISTTHCDIPQEVIDGSTGILCAEGDISALTNAIGRFYEMGEDCYMGYADAARKHIEKHFDARDCAAKMESLYRELGRSRRGEVGS